MNNTKGCRRGEGTDPSGPTGQGRKSSKCNRRRKKNLCRRKPVETLSGPRINEIFNKLNMLISDRIEVKALRKEEANDIIGILVSGSLPGLMRFSKVDQSIELMFNNAEIGKFRAVIQTDAFHREICKQRNNGIACLNGIAGRDTFHLQISGLAVNESNQKPFANTAIYGVAFPVANAKPLTYHFRPVRNEPVGLNGIIIGISGLLFLAAAPQILFA